MLIILPSLKPCPTPPLSFFPPSSFRSSSANLYTYQTSLEVAWPWLLAVAWLCTLGPPSSTVCHQNASARDSAGPQDGAIRCLIQWLHFSRGFSAPSGPGLGMREPRVLHAECKRVMLQGLAMMLGPLEAAVFFSASPPASPIIWKSMLPLLSLMDLISS